MIDTYGNKPVLKNYAQEFKQAVIANNHREWQLDFTKHVQWVATFDVPNDAKVVSNRVIYKINQNHDEMLMLKVRVAPQKNDKNMKGELKNNCCMCSSSEVRFVLSIESIKKGRLTKINVKRAVLQTGRTARDVYVVSPLESSDWSHNWLLSTGSYRIVTAFAKLQRQSYLLVLYPGLQQLSSSLSFFMRQRMGTSA